MSTLRKTLMLSAAAMMLASTAACAEGFLNKRADDRMENRTMETGKYGTNRDKQAMGRVHYDTLNSAEIMEVQQSLRENGENIPVDGVWGRRTTEAIRSFQRENDLRTTGNLDAATLAELDIKISRYNN